MRGGECLDAALSAVGLEELEVDRIPWRGFEGGPSVEVDEDAEAEVEAEIEVGVGVGVVEEGGAGGCVWETDSGFRSSSSPLASTVLESLLAFAEVVAEDPSSGL